MMADKRRCAFDLNSMCDERCFAYVMVRKHGGQYFGVDSGQRAALGLPEFSAAKEVLDAIDAAGGKLPAPEMVPDCRRLMRR